MRLFPLIAALTLLLSSCVRAPTPTATPPPPAATATAPSAPATPLPSTPPPVATPPPAAAPSPAPDLAAEMAPYLVAVRPELRAGLAPQLAGMTRYSMTVTLAPDITRLGGAVAIHYTNRETVPLGEIYLHLFPNLWNGGLTVSDVRLAGDPAAYSLEAGDDLLRVALRWPLRPGESADLALNFAMPVPSGDGVGNYGEFAYLDGILALAHFYPTVVVYDSGWRLETPAPQGDVVYHDASLYNVTFSAPADLVVVASGATAERRATDAGMATWRLAGGPLRDFNIVASRHFQSASTQVGTVTIHSYYLPKNEEGGKLVLGWSAGAVRALEAEVGPYPYAELDVAATATTAGGIEYPGLVVIAQRLYDDPNQYTLLESVAVHEVAHQWWYNVVGNDQLNAPWLDEALAQYGVYLYIKNVYRPADTQGFVDQMNLRWSRVRFAEKPIGLPVAAYSNTEYGAIVYGRGPLFLLALRERMGERRMAEFMQRYYREFAWGIATPADFRRLAEDAAGQGLGDLFAKWVYAAPGATPTVR